MAAKHFKAPVRATLDSVMKPVVVEAPAVAPKASSAWVAHVRETREKIGGTMKEAMKTAKASYARPQ